jgi:uncharacterized membrane protein
MNSAQLKALSLRFFKYFVNGLLLVSPVAITVYVVYLVITTLDGLIDFGIPGLGLVVSVTGIALIGYLGSNLLMDPILAFLEKMLTRAPFIKLIYTSVKDLMEAFVGDKRKFNQPIVVEMGDGLLKPGFMTQDDMAELGFGGYVAVYLPHSYNFSGNVFLAKAEKVHKVDTNATEYMKFIVSGGVTQVEEA